MQYMYSQQKGFTLIETLVTVALFSALAGIVGGTFLTMLNLQRRAFNVQQVQENASFILESMAKEIRVGQISSGDTGSCTSTPDSVLSMINQDGETVVYTLVDGVIHKNTNGTDSIVSSNAVVFDQLGFCIDGQPAGDMKQPRVTILASLHSTQSSQQATLHVQTTVSQRFLTD
jgi:prepilin-type N-terminal cleavage/methylation domain-containing protein